MSSEWEISGPLRGTRFAFGSVIDQMKFAASPKKWAAETIELQRRQFLSGNKESLPIAIRICGYMGMPLPQMIR
jgi:hypothetical protein